MTVLLNLFRIIELNPFTILKLANQTVKRHKTVIIYMHYIQRNRLDTLC